MSIGFIRYHSFGGDWYNDMVAGKALDENFEEVRDICSSQCHGDGERRKQTGAILFTFPFTIVNHCSSFVVYMAYKPYQLLCGDVGNNSTAVLMGGVFIANGLYATMWVIGGPVLMTVSVASFVVNQRLYNAMLFRRSFEGFILSFVLGNFCILETKEIVENTTELNVAEDADANREIEIKESPIKKKRSWTAKVKKTARWVSEKAKARLAAKRKKTRTDNAVVSSSRDKPNAIELDDIEMGRIPVCAKTHAADAIVLRRCDSLFDGLDIVAPQEIEPSSPNNLQPSLNDATSKRRSKNANEGPVSTKERSSRLWLRTSAVTQDSNLNYDVNESVVAEEDSVDEVPFDFIPKDRRHEKDCPKIEFIDAEKAVSTNIHVTTSKTVNPPTMPFNVKADASAHETTDTSLKLNNDVAIPFSSQKKDDLPAVSNDDINDSGSSPLGASTDVYIQTGEACTQVETHPGTVTWKSTIRDAVVEHRGSTFVDEHYSWIVSHLGQREFFVGSPEYGWKRLSPVQIRERCKEAYEMELVTNTENKLILKERGLKSPKKSGQSQSGELLDSSDDQPSDLASFEKDRPISPTMIKPFERLTKIIQSLPKTPGSTATEEETMIPQASNPTETQKCIDRVVKTEETSDSVENTNAFKNKTTFSIKTTISRMNQKSPTITEIRVGERDFVTVTTSSADDHNKIEQAPVDESVEIADVINVKAFLRKAAPKKHRKKKRSPNQTRAGVDRTKTMITTVEPVDESIEISDVIDVETLSLRKLRDINADRIAKDDVTMTVEQEPVDESIEVSEDVDIKRDQNKTTRPIRNDLRQLTKKTGEVLLTKVFKRSGTSDNQIPDEVTHSEVAQRRKGDSMSDAKKDYNGKKEVSRIPSLATVAEANSTKKAMDTIGGILRSDDSVSRNPKYGNTNHKLSESETGDNSVVMWTETDPVANELETFCEKESHEVNAYPMEGAIDYIGDMFCLDVRKRQNGAYKSGASVGGQSLGGTTLDSRDIGPTEVFSGDGSREGEPQEETNESASKQIPAAKVTKKLGFKNILPRITAKDRSVKIQKLDEKSKNDPELVKKWIASQTKALRNRSKLLNSVWTRAVSLRQKTSINKDKARDQEKINENEQNDITSWNEKNSMIPEQGSKPTSIQILFDAKSLEEEEAARKQKQEAARKQQGEAREAQTDAAGDTMNDQVMWVWFENYLKATPSLKEINALADDMSATDSGGSTITTTASLVSKVPAKNLLEFVERKIEEEILFSRLCVGDSVYSGLQCDAGLAYLRENDESGFLTDLIHGDEYCGVDRAISSFTNRIFAGRETVSN